MPRKKVNSKRGILHIHRNAQSQTWLASRMRSKRLTRISNRTASFAL